MIFYDSELSETKQKLCRGCGCCASENKPHWCPGPIVSEIDKIEISEVVSSNFCDSCGCRSSVREPHWCPGPL